MILESGAERLPQERDVGAEVAALQQLGQRARLSPAENDRRSGAQTALEQQRKIAPRARATSICGAFARREAIIDSRC
jgi:hypothetical protein